MRDLPYLLRLCIPFTNSHAQTDTQTHAQTQNIENSNSYEF